MIKNNKYYLFTIPQAFKELNSSEHGLASAEAKRRLEEFGYNELHEAKRDSIARIFFRQFKSPLIFILLLAAAVIFFPMRSQTLLSFLLS